MKGPPIRAEGAAEGHKAAPRALGPWEGSRTAQVPSVLWEPRTYLLGHFLFHFGCLVLLRGSRLLQVLLGGRKGDVEPCGGPGGPRFSAPRGHPPGLKDEKRPSSPFCMWCVITRLTRGVTEPRVRTHGGGSDDTKASGDTMYPGAQLRTPLN